MVSVDGEQLFKFLDSFIRKRWSLQNLQSYSFGIRRNSHCTNTTRIRTLINTALPHLTTCSQAFFTQSADKHFNYSRSLKSISDSYILGPIPDTFGSMNRCNLMFQSIAVVRLSFPCVMASILAFQIDFRRIVWWSIRTVKKKVIGARVIITSVPDFLD